MTHQRGVLDTSTYILSRHIDAALLPDEPLLTAVSLAELSVGPLLTTDATERVERQREVQEAEAMFEPLAFDAAAARTFGRVAASLQEQGRKRSARAFDALIAATAMANDLPLYTCNPADFADIDGLTVVAVPVPDDGY